VQQPRDSKGPHIARRETEKLRQGH
jgi:hypothetical protein